MKYFSISPRWGSKQVGYWSGIKVFYGPRLVGFWLNFAAGDTLEHWLPWLYFKRWSRGTSYGSIVFPSTEGKIASIETIHHSRRRTLFYY